jgi:transposase
MGVDEIHLGKRQKFITVVSNLDTGEPVWFGRERRKETLDEFFTTELSRPQRMRITSPCVDIWKPYRLSIEQHAPTAGSFTTSSTSWSMLLDHVDGMLNYYRTKVRLGMVEAINGNIKSLLRRGRGYKNLVQEPAISAAESSAHGRDLDGIRGLREGGIM